MLLYSVTGNFKLPGLRAEAAFSKLNWGNHTTMQSNKTVKCHSVFQKRIQYLKDQQWDDIISTALEQVDHSLQVNEQKGSEDVEMEEESDDDEDLFNLKYDGITDGSFDAAE
jgi:hypothetical protein